MQTRGVGRRKGERARTCATIESVAIRAPALIARAAKGERPTAEPSTDQQPYTSLPGSEAAVYRARTEGKARGRKERATVRVRAGKRARVRDEAGVQGAG